VTPTSERIAPLSRDDISADTLATLRTAFPRAATYLTDRPDAPPMPPILGLLARHAALSGGWLAYNGALLDHGVLDPRARELLILAVARRTDSPYLWREHARIARAVGVTEEEIDALDGCGGDRWPALDAALLCAVDEMLERDAVGDATWTTLAEHFDERELLELLFVVGTYTCLAMVLNSVGLAPPEDEQR
jgi:alkylhydroperoxidase family enzyme